MVASESMGAAPFRMRVAGLLVEVRPLYGGVRRLCADYIVDGAATSASVAAGLDGGAGAAGAGAGTGAGDAASVGAGAVPVPPGGAAGSENANPRLVVTVAPEDIERERELSTEGTWSSSYLETLAVLRAIADAAPAHSRMLMHGAVLAWRGRAYMFCAPSGTGKSTHLRLWHKHLDGGAGRVRVINGDKPLVEVRRGEPAIVYGTPWAGKEGWQENSSAPLAGLCFIERAEPGESRIERLAPAAALDRAMRQTYMPEDAPGVAATLEMLDALLTQTPLWLLHADMSEDAVRTSFEALTSESYAPAGA